MLGPVPRHTHFPGTRSRAASPDLAQPHSTWGVCPPTCAHACRDPHLRFRTEARWHGDETKLRRSSVAQCRLRGPPTFRLLDPCYIVTRSSYIVTCTSYIVTRLSQHRVGAATCCHPQMQPRRTSHLPPSHSRQHRYRRTFMPPPWDKHSTQPPTAPRTGTVTPVPHSHSQCHAQLAAMPSQGSSYLSPLESGL